MKKMLNLLMVKSGSNFFTRIILCTILTLVSIDYAYSCKISTIGELDKNIINESSGLSVSNNYPDRLYHINDSGGGSFFYTTDLQGKNTKKFKISGFFPLDLEDISLARCPHDKTKDCLYVADIGDNYRFRPSIKIAIIEEKQNFSKKVKPYKVINAKYPDKKQNAESFFVNPVNGDFYIVSKNYDKNTNKAVNPNIYRIPVNEVNSKSNYRRKLQKITTLPFLSWLSDERKEWDKIITAADINKSGDKLLLLTYKNAVEIDIVNHSNKPITFTNNKKIRHLRRLKQQESVAYIDNLHHKGFLYSTELSYDIRSDLVLAECKEDSDFEGVPILKSNYNISSN